MSQENDRRTKVQSLDIGNGKGDQWQSTDAGDQRLAQSLALFDFSLPLPMKENNTLRLFYNNCNGFAINNTIGIYLKQKKDKVKYNYITDIESPTKVDSIIRQMKIWEVDIVNLSEVCISWEKQVPRQVVQQITKRYDRTGCWTMTSSKIEMGGFLKPGGAGILTMGHGNGNLTDRGVDPLKMGRWVYTLYSGPQNGKKLLVITGYRTGLRTTTPGAKTAWAQQQTMLCQQNRSEKPHEAFLVDLSTWIQTYRRPEMEMVLCLDANEQWGQNSDITKFANKFQLKNINMEFALSPTHPNLANPSRSTTIDYCLCSPLVMQNVRYAASVPFDLETLGDHRGVVIDLDISSILGGVTKMDEIKLRKLVLSSPKAVENYLQLVEEKFQQQNVFTRATKLLKRVTSGETDVASITRQYENLDKDVFGICKKAEHKCKPSWAGPYEWSPALAKAIQELRYWRYRLNNTEETEFIKVMGKKLDIKYTPLSKFVLQMMVNESRTRLTEVQTNSRKYRQDHLEGVARQYAELHNMSKQQAVVELLAHEEARTTFTMLRQKLKPYQRSGLATLWEAMNEEGVYTKDPALRISHTDGKIIHSKLLERNAEHLTQASGTPFARGWLRNRLKWDGTGPLAEELLTGNLLNERRFKESMQLYLESLKMNDLSRMNVVRPMLSLEEYQSFWKKKRETTVTSPFGLHVGHYKASVHKLNILNVHRILLLIPFKTGIVPSRWRRTVQTMIEKEPSAPWIHRLRIIELFDAQANAGFQIFVGRNMMRYAVHNNLLEEESFGSTPGKMATSALVQKLVSVDQLRIERRAGGIFDCDASGCYDRILPPLASVHLQALGLHKSIGTFLSRLMFQAQRHVKTNHGVSKRYIRTKKKRVLHGIGQGNGGGPAMWIAHLTVMFTAMKAVCWGVAMHCVEKIFSVSTVGTGYVDDVTLGLSVPKDQPQTEHMVYKHIKRMGQLWENLLYLTGGRLELSKCFWIPISWRWIGGKPRMVYKQQMRRNLRLRESETKDMIDIPRRTGKETEKRLGVWSSCDGKWTKEVNLWITHSKDFSQRLKGNTLSRRAGELAYHAVWLSKFRSSASVIGYTSNQLQAIQSTIIGQCLSVAGYNNKFPRAVVFGPAHFGGMGWENILGLSIFEKVKLLIGSVRLGDTLGHMILIQLTWLQLFAGSSVPILQSKRVIPYLPAGWLTNIHAILVEHRIQVELASGWLPSIQRENDRVLMDIVHTQIPQRMWEGINRCRLYLKANTVADIASIDGTYIPKKIRRVKGTIRGMALDFPEQTRPPSEDIEQWEYFISLIALEGVLHSPLGAWVRSPDQHFKFLINDTATIVYRKTGPNWVSFCRQSNKSKRYVRGGEIVASVPGYCTPVSVIEAANYIVVLHSNSQSSREFGLPQDIYTRRQRTMERHVLGNYRIDDTLFHQLQSIWQSTDCKLLCATDGGLKDSVGTSSYAFFLPDIMTPILTGRAGEWQPRDNASSTRQELLGQLGVEYWLSRLERKWGRPRHGVQITLITDSKASMDIMDNLSRMIGIKDTLRPELDVALEIYRQRLSHPWAQLYFSKVESHIPQEEAPDEFLWACNTFVDDEATKARLDFPVMVLRKRPDFLFPGAVMGCKINGRIINNGLFEAIKYHLTGPTLRRYLMEKYHWNETIIDQIDWKAHSKALKTIPQGQKATVIKYIHGWLATKKRRYREGYSPNAQCALCEQQEDRLHIFRCSHPQVKGIRHMAWVKYLADLGKDTEGSCQAVFQAGLETVLGGQHPDCGTKAQWPEELRAAYDDQLAIGWDQILFGRFAQSWDGLAQYRMSAGVEVQSGVWTQRAVKLSWSFGLECWRLRNQVVHGSTGGVSELEKERVQELITRLYRRVIPELPQRHKELMTQSKEDVLGLPYHSQVAWLGHLKFLQPDKFLEVLSEESVLCDADLPVQAISWTAILGGNFQ